MGLTRYFNCHVTLTPELAHNVQNIIDASSVSLAGPDGSGVPEVTTGRVSFNGAGSDSGEPFTLTNGNNASYCTTDGKPYDAVIVEIFNLLKTIDKDFYTDTDGYDDSDLIEAKFNKTFN